MKRNVLLFLLVIVVITFCFATCSPKLGPYEFSQEASYLVIASKMLRSKGEIVTFDSSGKRLDQYGMSIQDVGIFSRASDQGVYAAGQRSNSNLIIQNRKLESFFLLDDDRYSGSTAVLMDEKRTFSSMNGNHSEEVGYESLLVARDRKTGETLYQTIVPLFTTEMLKVDEQIYLVGTNAGPDHDDAVIVVVNQETGQILKTLIYPEYREAFAIVRVADQILVEMTRKSDLKQEIFLFENDSLRPLETPVVYDMPMIDSDAQFLYVFENGILRQITPKGEVIQQVELPNRSCRILNTEVLGDDLYVYQLEGIDKRNAIIHVNQYNRADFTKRRELLLETPKLDIMLVVRLMD